MASVKGSGRSYGLVVVSPHRDDAAFSAGITIDLWPKRGWPVTIINCYTISDYAPNHPNLSKAAVTELRRMEDYKFREYLGGGIKFMDLNLLDAPLRFCFPVNMFWGIAPTS